MFAGDIEALQVSREALRDRFRENMAVEDTKKIGVLSCCSYCCLVRDLSVIPTTAEMIREIDDADHFLRTNIVQASLNERGNYGKSHFMTSAVQCVCQYDIYMLWFWSALR